MKAKELSKVLKEIVKVLDKHPEAIPCLNGNIYSDEDEELLDLHAEFDERFNRIYLSIF